MTQPTGAAAGASWFTVLIQVVYIIALIAAGILLGNFMEDLLG